MLDCVAVHTLRVPVLKEVDETVEYINMQCNTRLAPTGGQASVQPVYYKHAKGMGIRSRARIP